jgi:hypothetical protein
VLRAVPSITFGFVGMAVIAYALGRVSRTEWVWWLAPLTVAVDGCCMLRVGVGDGGTLASPLEKQVVTDLDARTFFASSAAATGMAGLGAFAGNRLAIITGAALTIVGTTLLYLEETAGEHTARRITSRRIRPARGARRQSITEPSSPSNGNGNRESQ